MTGDEKEKDAFEATLRKALVDDAEPRLVAARIAAAIDARRESAALWRIFSPGRLALIGSLATAGGVAIALFLPVVGLLDPDVLMATAFAGSLS